MMLTPRSGAKFTTYTRHVPKVESLLDLEPRHIPAAPQAQIRVTMLTAGSDELSKLSLFDPGMSCMWFVIRTGNPSPRPKERCLEPCCLEIKGRPSSHVQRKSSVVAYSATPGR